MVKLLYECVRYFKSNKGFARAFDKIREKYRSLGYLGGRIHLSDMSEAEKEALTGFLRKNYYKDSAFINVDSFQKALEHTRFNGLDFEEILTAYFGEKLISKKDQLELYNAERAAFFEEIIKVYSNSRAEAWLRYILETKDNAYRTITMKYDNGKMELKTCLDYACTALNTLPVWENKTVRLAVFSSRISKNPHTFDDGSECGKLLIYGISYVLQKKQPENAEERLELLYNAGIMKDEVSNFTVCSGILGYIEGELHKGWQEFYQTGEVLMLSLLNLSKVDRASSPSGKVFVFENPTVFTEVYDRTSNLKPALVCTYGQVKVASLVLLDMLYRDGCEIYYSGDFDPEGLSIAGRLKDRYREKLVLWGYEKQRYTKALSEEKLSAARLSKLDKINDEALKEIALTIKDTQFAGYQELLIDALADDISNVLQR